MMYEMPEWKLPKLECRKCGHQWSPRKNKLPKICPECKNTKWWLEKWSREGEVHDIINSLIGYEK